jgi:APA family basic amino acid/polyamine antiporter
MSGSKQRNVDLFGATSIVVANMIGTGVFTSLGYQLFDIQSGFGIVMIWLVGGLLALCGAFCYAELATRLPEDGGEYYFLSKIYHPALGFVAGFVSSTVGFAAPIAGASIALGAYVHGVWPGVNETALAIIIITLISIIFIITIILSSVIIFIIIIILLIIIIIITITVIVNIFQIK